MSLSDCRARMEIHEGSEIEWLGLSPTVVDGSGKEIREQAERHIGWSKILFPCLIFQYKRCNWKEARREGGKSQKPQGVECATGREWSCWKSLLHDESESGKAEQMDERYAWWVNVKG